MAPARSFFGRPPPKLVEADWIDAPGAPCFLPA
jgi:hypothetical protein